MAELSWPYSSPSDQQWYRDVPRDCGKWPFRFGLLRGVVQVSGRLPSEPDGISGRLPSGPDGVLRALRSMVSMQLAGPALLHRWIQARREQGDSWGSIAQVLGVARQTAHERFTRPAPSGPYDHANAANQLWASVQVARDQAVGALVATPGGVLEGSWDGWRPSRASSRLRARRSLDGWPPPPRDQDDLAVLCRILGCIEEELAWLVAEARARGVTWVLLSKEFKVRRQAIYKRFHEPVAAILTEASKASARRVMLQFPYHGSSLHRPRLPLPNRGCICNTGATAPRVIAPGVVTPARD
jgi:hypothetical protein